jgi:hypothetical protein
LERGRLAFWYWIRSWGQRNPKQAGILLLEPCYLLPQSGILLGQAGDQQPLRRQFLLPCGIPLL